MPESRKKNAATKDREQKIIETFANCEDFGDPKMYFQKLLETKHTILKDTNIQLMIEMLKALGDEDRFLILELLAQKDRCVCELEAALEKTQPAVSHHLKILEKAKLIRGWKKGKFTHYSLIEPRFNQFCDLFTNWSKSITNWFGKINLDNTQN